jgi:hypothetical protein
MKVKILGNDFNISDFFEGEVENECQATTQTQSMGPLSSGDSGHGGPLSFICRQRVLRPCNMHPIKLFRNPRFEPRWAVEDTDNCLHAGLAGLDICSSGNVLIAIVPKDDASKNASRVRSAPTRQTHVLHRSLLELAQFSTPPI